MITLSIQDQPHIVIDVETITNKEELRKLHHLLRAIGDELWGEDQPINPCSEIPLKSVAFSKPWIQTTDRYTLLEIDWVMAKPGAGCLLPIGKIALNSRLLSIEVNDIGLEEWGKHPHSPQHGDEVIGLILRRRK